LPDYCDDEDEDEDEDAESHQQQDISRQQVLHLAAPAFSRPDNVPVMFLVEDWREVGHTTQ
jgi:hypothetical protein